MGNMFFNNRENKTEGSSLKAGGDIYIDSSLLKNACINLVAKIDNEDILTLKPLKRAIARLHNSIFAPYEVSGDDKLVSTRNTPSRLKINADQLEEIQENAWVVVRGLRNVIGESNSLIEIKTARAMFADIASLARLGILPEAEHVNASYLKGKLLADFRLWVLDPRHQSSSILKKSEHFTKHDYAQLLEQAILTEAPEQIGKHEKPPADLISEFFEPAAYERIVET